MKDQSVSEAPVAGAPKAETCFVHIGIAKTGTTAIQNYMFRNKKRLLEEYGLAYPGPDANHWHLMSLFSKDPCSLIQVQRLKLSGPQAVTNYLGAYKAAFESEVRRPGVKTILVSSEYLVGMPPDELEALNAYLRSLAERIVVIAYVRDPWTYATSLAQEDIRTGRIREKLSFSYARANAEVLEKFEKNFPGEMIVHPYLGGSSFHSVAHICGVLGLDEDTSAMKPEDRVNLSMGRDEARLLLHLNKVWPQFDAKGRFVFNAGRDWVREAIHEAAGKDQPIELSRFAALKIWLEGRDDLEVLDERYLNGMSPFRDYYKSRVFLEDGESMLSISQLERSRLIDLLFSVIRNLARRAVEFHERAIHAELQLEQSRRHQHVANVANAGPKAIAATVPHMGGAGNGPSSPQCD